MGSESVKEEKKEGREERSEKKEGGEERSKKKQEVKEEATEKVQEVEAPPALSEEQERLQRKEMLIRAEQLIASISRRRAEVGRLMMVMLMIALTMFVQLETLVEGAAGTSNKVENLHRWVLAECHRICQG